jgi:hypothetical protein
MPHPPSIVGFTKCLPPENDGQQAHRHKFMDVKQNRYEFKYLVPVALLQDLRQAIAPFVDLDRYTRKDSGDYTIHTIYFDTSSLDYYREKVAGIEIRKKVRVRAYNEPRRDAPVFLEIKRKKNLFIAKNRARLLYRYLDRLFLSGDVERYVGPSAVACPDREDARRFFYHIYRYSLRPIVLIHYEREAFFRKFDPSVRITLDKHLRSSPFPTLADLFAEDHDRPSLSEHFVLEVKFYKGIPDWLKDILGYFDLKREAISKYCLCLEEHGIPWKVSTRALQTSSTQLPFMLQRQLFTSQADRQRTMSSS